MLTESDIERFDAIMNGVLQIREARGFNVPVRDEDKIAEILSRGERAADEERQALVDSERLFAGPVKAQRAAKDSDTLKNFSALDRWRGQDEDEDDFDDAA